MKHPIVSGIYAIACLPTGDVYVGSSVNTGLRLRVHRWQMRAGRHANSKLQGAWNLYGEDRFEFKLLEEVGDVDTLVAREQSWMGKFEKLFNIKRIATHSGFRVNAVPFELDIGNELTALESYLGLSASQVAKILGVAYSTYAAYKNGSRVIPEYHHDQAVILMMLDECQLADWCEYKLKGTGKYGNKA